MIAKQKFNLKRRTKISFILFIALFAARCSKDQATTNVTKTSSPSTPSATTVAASANQITYTNNNPTDNSKNLQALIANNVTIYFPKGTYNFTNFVSINNNNTIHIYAAPGTVFQSSIDKIFEISGQTSDIEINNISFVSTKSSTVNDTEGIIFIANYGATDVMNNINIHDCKFSNPNTLCDAIKLVSEGTNSLAKNITITLDTFKSVGRFGVELQNNNYTPMVARFTNYNINNNNFQDVGTIQSGPASSCVSVTGYGLNGVIDNNYFLNMRMNTTSNVYYGIENAGTVNLETKGNTFVSNTYGFTGLLGSGPTLAESISRNQPLKTNWVIENNTFNLIGSTTDKTKIRAMDLGDTYNYFIENNNMNTDGQCIRFSNCQNGLISSNVMTTNFGNALYFQDGSTKNKVTSNTITSKGPNQGTVFFDGTSTNTNYAFGNTLTKANGVAGDYRNDGGAYNNF